MVGFILIFLSQMFPVAVAGAILFGWSHVTRTRQLRAILQWFTILAGAALAILSLLLTIVFKSYTGNILYGFESCTRFSNDLAGSVLAANWIGWFLAVVGFVAIVLIGLIAEGLAYRQSRTA